MTSLPLRTSRRMEGKNDEKRNEDEVSKRDFKKGISREKSLQKDRRQSWLDKLIFQACGLSCWLLLRSGVKWFWEKEEWTSLKKIKKVFAIARAKLREKIVAGGGVAYNTFKRRHRWEKIIICQGIQLFWLVFFNRSNSTIKRIHVIDSKYLKKLILR